MPELPASVRLALWSTVALARGTGDLEHAVEAATPDLADVDAAAAVARLDLWGQFGERVVLVSLPSPGDLVGMPHGSADFVGLAIEAGECAWSPLLGGALVPVFETYGPVDDLGTAVRWESYDCTPPPRHHVEGISPADVERTLRQVLIQAVEALEDLDVPAWDAGLRDLADERLASGRWGLPAGIGTRTRRALTQAAVLGTIAETALAHLHDAPSLAAGVERSRVLLTVARESRRALASAACAAAFDLADG